MPKYKVLNAVAHNVASSFVSTVNRCEEDYVPGALLARSRESGQAHYFIDMIGEGQSVAFDDYPFTRVAPAYRKMFWDNVSSQGSAVEFVKWARLEIEFDLAAKHRAGASPFRCEVKLIDARGIDHSRAVLGTWAPEPFHFHVGPLGWLWRLWLAIRKATRRHGLS